MKPRREVTSFIKSQFEKPSDKKPMHYGLVELRELLDFIYEGTPNGDEHLMVATLGHDNRIGEEAIATRRREIAKEMASCDHNLEPMYKYGTTKVKLICSKCKFSKMVPYVKEEHESFFKWR